MHKNSKYAAGTRENSSSAELALKSGLRLSIGVSVCEASSCGCIVALVVVVTHKGRSLTCLLEMIADIWYGNYWKDKEKCCRFV